MQPRAYPEKLGQSLREIYLKELKQQPQGDLRLNLTPSRKKSPVELFNELDMGDSWQDASLLPVFEYLYFCRHTRTFQKWLD